MSVQRISVFPLATSFKVNDVLLGNKANTTSRFSFSTVTQSICSIFLQDGNFVFVPSGATAGQVIAYSGTDWTTSSNVSKLIIGGSSTPRATLDVLGGVRAKQGAPTVGNTSNFGYAFEGDGDTGMFSIPPPGGENNGSLSFFLNQTESMRLAVGGNVGIGVTNPLDKLHIDGGIIASQIRTNDPAAIFEIIGGVNKATAKASISVKGIGEIDFSTGNTPTPRININNAGTVTFYNPIIGTTATLDQFIVKRAGTPVGMVYSANTNLFDVEAVGASTVLRLNTNSRERVRITTDGRVGIGTASPTDTLHVSGGFTVTNNPNSFSSIFYDTNIKGPSLQMSGLSGAYIDLASTTVGGVAGSLGDYTLRIATNGVSHIPSVSGCNYINSNQKNFLLMTNDTPRMSILTDGNVGIGTTAPTSKLQVEGTLRVGRQDSGIEGAEIQLCRALDNQIDWFIDALGSGTDTRLRFHKGTVKGEKVTILDNGNVGIGLINPISLLQVQGDIRIQNGNYVYFSDVSDQTRIKRDIGNNGLSLETSAVTRMFIADGGNVGIGTSTPNHSLVVRRDTAELALFSGTNDVNQFTGIRVENRSSSSSQQAKGYYDFYNGSVNVSNMHTIMKTDGSADLYFSTTPAGSRISDRRQSRLYITGAGDIGMGVDNPISKLHVSGGNSSSTMMIETSQAETALNIRNTSLNGKHWRIATGGSGGTYAGGAFGIFDVTSSRAVLTCNSDGSTTVGGMLKLQAGADNFNPVDANNSSGVYIKFEADTPNLGTAGSTDWAYLRQIGGTDDFHLALDLHDNEDNLTGGQRFSIRNVPSAFTPDLAPTTRFTINGVGNVGIGIANPTARLHVDGGIIGTTGNFSGNVTAPTFTGRLIGPVTGTTGNFSGAVTAPSFVGGTISGSTGNFTGNVAAPGFIGGTVSGSTGNFTGNVTAPNFVGNLIGGTVSGSTGTFSGRVGIGTTAPTDFLHVAAGGGTFGTGTRPTGWGGGITTWDVYAGGTLGTGSATGSLSATIGSNGIGWFRTMVGTGVGIGVFNARMESNGSIHGTTGNFSGNVTASNTTVNGILKLRAGADDATTVDAKNLSGVYIKFEADTPNLGTAGSTDWAYLRQIGGTDEFHLALDFHDNPDNANGQMFSIRNFASVPTPDFDPVTRFTINGFGNVGIGIANPTARLHVNGGIIGTTGTFSTSVSAPALSGSFFGNIRGATGNFSTSVTAPTFFGSLQGGTVSGTTGNFSTSVTAPTFFGSLQGGTVSGTTGNFSTSVTAPGFTGAFFGDGGGLTNLRSYPFATIRNITTTGTYNLVNLDVNTVLVFQNGASTVSAVIPLQSTFVAPIGTQIILIQQGTGAISIAAAAGVTLTSTGNKRRIFGQNAAAVLIKIADNSWVLGGDIKV
jgi:hypothetical protein